MGDLGPRASVVRMSVRRWFVAFASILSVSCGSGGSGGHTHPFPIGGDGVADPLAVPAGEARAGRIDEGELPADASEYLTWRAGDFVLANERVAMVIEDVGASDLYDPWGGKPVGLGRVEGGALVDPADFGEIFFFTGRYTIMTEHVGVVADGRDGGPAIVRAQGLLRPLPFLDNLGVMRSFFTQDFEGVWAALDYVLEPGADYVDVFASYYSEAPEEVSAGLTLHGFMYTRRMRVWSNRGRGFDAAADPTDYIAFVDDEGASYTYSRLDKSLNGGVTASGFVSNFAETMTIPVGESTQHRARITIGGRGLDGALVAHARMEGATLRSVTGRVVDGSGTPVAGARVHAMSIDAAPAHRNRATTAADGTFTMHLPDGEAVDLYVWRRGDRLAGPTRVEGTQTAAGDLVMPGGGYVVVAPTTELGGGVIPARIQVRPGPSNADPIPEPDPVFGEERVASGRIQQVFALPGETTVLRLPAGEWEVIVSRGYEYEIHTQVENITAENCDPVANAAACPKVTAVLERSVDTTGQMCADFHVHTRRSNDADDGPRLKLISAAADGLEIPARSDHEYVEAWDDEAMDLGLAPYLYGLSSLELTTFEAYGHFGVVPVDPDPSAVNGGAIQWQTFPTPETPDVPVGLDPAPTLFARVLARPEQPALIVNHPRGSTNYFGYVGLDPVTGAVVDTASWDPSFHAIEVFNNKSWTEARDNDVTDWLALLNTGMRFYAVGSSDSHGIDDSPVGYPRTCLEVGVDAPPGDAAGRRAFADDVRDAIIAGQMVVNGGVHVEASVGGVGPGGEAVVGGTTAMLDVRVQAPSWVDVGAIEIIVDGVVVRTILAADFTPGVGAEIHLGTHSINVDPLGSYVIVAAYGDVPMIIQPGKLPFGATNPVFLTP